MGKLVLYIAISLDGYIADAAGGIGWLEAFNAPDEDYGYTAFLARVGAVIVGGTTFRQVLGFDAWPYPGLPCAVITRQPLPTLPGADLRAFAGDVRVALGELRARTDKDIWLIGGGQMVTEFANAGLIDEYIVSVMPVLLGGGVALAPGVALQHLDLRAITRYARGVAQLTYARAGATDPASS